MSLLDDYQKSQEENAGEAGAPADPADDRRARAEIERQITMTDSDLKKTIREIEDMEQQKRRFKKEEERLRVEENILDTEVKKLYNTRMSLEEEIRGLKKKLKMLL